MNYWRFETHFLNSAAFALAEPVAVTTWLRLLNYCVEQELAGGVMVGAAAWDTRSFLLVARVSRAEVDAAVQAGLVVVDGDNLQVLHFPEDELNSLDTARTAGKKGGRPAKTPPDKPPGLSPRFNPPDKPPGETLPETLSYRKGKDRIGEEEEKERVSPDGAHPRDAAAVFQFTQSLGMGWTMEHAEFWFNHMEAKGWALNQHGTQTVTSTRQWQALCKNAKSWVIDRVAQNSQPSGPKDLGKKKKSVPPWQEEEDFREAIAPRSGRPEPAGDWQDAFRWCFDIEPKPWDHLDDTTQVEVLKELERRKEAA